MNIIFVSFLVSCVWCGGSAACDAARECITDLSQADCPTDHVLVPNTNIFNCCPSCVLNSLVPEQQGCQAPSNCLPDGKYAPVQCKGDLFVGRCFCSDENGNRIFGQMWRNEASSMTCACSRRRAELEAAGRGDVTLHCTPSGDYEPLQCDGGVCWCAEPAGQPRHAPVPAQDLALLPCYSRASVGTGYLRRCESATYAMAVIDRERIEHNTRFLGTSGNVCEYDGSYGPYTVQGTIAYCAGRDGSILGSWQDLASETANMNCNCARDTAIYFPERGLAVSEVCTASGGYRPHQQAGDRYYCVDRDGYPTTALLDAWPDDQCQSYA